MWTLSRFRMACAAAVLLVVATASASSPTATETTETPAPARVNGWYPCAYSSPHGKDDATFEEMTVFDCAEIEVPLCYEGVCESDRKINFFVKRLLAETPPEEDAQRKALILIQGGPGAASPEMEGSMKTMLDLLGNTVDYYTFDHRGTGRSEFLNCDAAQALTSGSPDGTSVSLDELDSCFQDLNFQYDDQAAAFSTTSAAMDVKTMIETFLFDHDVYVAGYSYGTYLTQRIMQLQVPQVVGYIFDGVDVLSTNEDPVEGANSHWNQAIHAPARRLLEFCYDDANCLLKFKSRETVLEDVLAFFEQLDKDAATNACAKVLVESSTYPQPSVVLRTYMGELVKDITDRVTALKVLGRVQRCSKKDLKALKKVFLGDSDNGDVDEKAKKAKALHNKGARLAGVPDPLNDMSDLLYDVIVYSERWSQPAPTKAQRDDFFLDGAFSTDDAASALGYCVFTGSTEPACEELRDQLPTNATQTFYYEHDDVLKKPMALPDHASALIITGGLDFQTPKEFGELLYSKLNGTGQGVMLVTFDYGVHCNGEAVEETSFSTKCNDAITAAFVAHNGQVDAINTNCMSSLSDTHFG